MASNGNGPKNPWGNGGSGGNNGGNGQNPWGGRGGGGGNRGGHQPPNIEELLKRAGDNFGGLPFNFSGGKGAVLIVLLLAAMWMASGFYTVEPGVYAVVQRFGAWERTKVEEGLGYRAPWPIETVEKINVSEIQKLNIGFSERFMRGVSTSQKIDVEEESLMLTSDRNIVDLDLVVQWNIKSAEDYLFNIKDQEDTIKKVAESAIREVVGQSQMFLIITRERDLVAQKTREIIQTNLDEYHSGVNISQVLIQKAEVHPDVQGAFQDVQSAKQDAEDVQNRAQVYREDILPKARGQAVKMQQEAKAYEESTVAKATGDAERFNSVYRAYLTGKDVTRERIYLETMEDVMRNANKTILDSKGSQGVVPYLPLNQLNNRNGQ